MELKLYDRRIRISGQLLQGQRSWYWSLSACSIFSCLASTVSPRLLASLPGVASPAAVITDIIGRKASHLNVSPPCCTDRFSSHRIVSLKLRSAQRRQFLGMGLPWDLPHCWQRTGNTSIPLPRYATGQIVAGTDQIPPGSVRIALWHWMNRRTSAQTHGSREDHQTS